MHIWRNWQSHRKTGYCTQFTYFRLHLRIFHPPCAIPNYPLLRLYVTSFQNVSPMKHTHYLRFTGRDLSQRMSKNRIQNHVWCTQKQPPNQHWELRVHPFPRGPILNKAYQPPRVCRNIQLQLVRNNNSSTQQSVLSTYNTILLWLTTRGPDYEQRILSLQKEHERWRKITWATITRLSLYQTRKHAS